MTRRTTVYCPQPECRGHQFTEAQLRAEAKAGRPYSLYRSTQPPRRLAPHAPLCFRELDRNRAEAHAREFSR